MGFTQLEDPARAALLELFVDYGYGIFEDPQNLDNMLRDRFGGSHSRERRALVCALREGFPEQMQRSGDAMLRALTVSRLIAHLENECALDSSVARWSVQTLALAIYGDTPPVEERRDQRPPETEDLQSTSDKRAKTQLGQRRIGAFAVATCGWLLCVIPAVVISNNSEATSGIILAFAVQCFLSILALQWIVKKQALENQRNVILSLTAWLYAPNLLLAAVALSNAATGKADAIGPFFMLVLPPIIAAIYLTRIFARKAVS